MASTILHSTFLASKGASICPHRSICSASSSRRSDRPGRLQRQQQHSGGSFDRLGGGVRLSSSRIRGTRDSKYHDPSWRPQFEQEMCLTSSANKVAPISSTASRVTLLNMRDFQLTQSAEAIQPHTPNESEQQEEAWGSRTADSFTEEPVPTAMGAVLPSLADAAHWSNATNDRISRRRHRLESVPAHVPSSVTTDPTAPIASAPYRPPHQRPSARQEDLMVQPDSNGTPIYDNFIVNESQDTVVSANEDMPRRPTPGAAQSPTIRATLRQGAAALSTRTPETERHTWLRQMRSQYIRQHVWGKKKRPPQQEVPDSCQICFEDMSSHHHFRECGHGVLFCGLCAARVDTCPFCRCVKEIECGISSTRSST